MNTTPRPMAKDYKHIRAWGKYMGSHNYYIRNQQENAAADGAPIDACYEKSDGKWACASDMRPELQETLKGMIA